MGSTAEDTHSALTVDANANLVGAVVSEFGLRAISGGTDVLEELRRLCKVLIDFLNRCEASSPFEVPISGPCSGDSGHPRVRFKGTRDEPRIEMHSDVVKMVLENEVDRKVMVP